MKKILLILLSVIMISTVIAFDYQISYAGIGMTNTSDSSIYNGTYSVTTFAYYDSSCTGTPDYSETSTGVTIINGDYGIDLNYTLTFNQTIYLVTSIAGDNQSCMKYTASPYSPYSDQANNATLLQGYTPSTLPIAGNVTGTLAQAIVSQISLSNVLYSGLLGFNNLTTCSENEILKISSGDWACDSDSTGNDNYADGVSVTGTTTKNLTISRSGALASLSILFIDDRHSLNSTDLFNHSNGVVGLNYTTLDAKYSGGGNSTPEIRAAVNDSSVVYAINISCEFIVGGSDSDYCTDATSGAGGYVLNLTTDTGDGDILDSEILTVAGGNNINTTFSGSTLTINSELVDTDTTYNFNSTDLFNHSNGQVGLNHTTLASLYLDDTDTTCDGSTCSIANTGTLDGYNAADLLDNTDSNASTICSGTTTYLDGEGNCDDISGVYVTVGTKLGNSTAEIQAVAVGGEVSGTVGSITLDHDALDDQYYDSEGDLTGLLDDNYVDVSGDTMTGNLIVNTNVTVENLLLENDVANHKIYDNSTCTIITGDTSQVEIC